MEQLAEATEQAAAEVAATADLAAADWGEKPTRAFFGRVRALRQRTSIKQLFRFSDGKEDTSKVDSDPVAIAESLASYYEDLFQERQTMPDVTRDILKTYAAADDETARRLGADLTTAEVKRAIMVAGKNKSPGSTGIVSELYQAIADSIAPVLAAQFNWARKHEGRLSAY